MNRLLIPDEPLPLDRLRSLDAEVKWRIGEMVTLLMDYHDVEIDLDLRDGRLQIDPLRGVGEGGGSVTGSIALEPDGSEHRLSVKIAADQLRYALSSSARDRSQHVPHDIRVDLSGAGNTLHEMAAGVDGRIAIVQGEGRFDNSALDKLTTDVMAKVSSTLNPFSKKDRYTGLECGVHVIEFEEGVAKLGPLVMLTDKMKIAGRGKIDFETEKLDLNFAAKPRKGIGLSASTFTNPYIKLGGTLSKPKMTVKPLEAATATAAAITTVGLSIVAKGFWDRFTSGKRACKKATKKAGIK